MLCKKLGVGTVTKGTGLSGQSLDFEALFWSFQIDDYKKQLSHAAQTCLRLKNCQNNTWKPHYQTAGHNWLHTPGTPGERSQSIMSALLSEVTVQWFRKTIKVPVQSAILCRALIKDKRSHETQNHTNLIDFHYHSQWLWLTYKHVYTNIRHSTRDALKGGSCSLARVWNSPVSMFLFSTASTQNTKHTSIWNATIRNQYCVVLSLDTF